MTPEHYVVSNKTNNKWVSEHKNLYWQHYSGFYSSALSCL